GIPAGNLISFGRMLVAQEKSWSEVQAAVQSFLVPRWEELAYENQEYLAEWLIATGRKAEAAPIVASWGNDTLRARLLAADLANPFAGQDASEETWISTVNALLRPSALDPVLLLSGNAAPLDRIDAVPSDSASGPLVTVIMTCHRPDRTIFTAI